MTQASIRTLDSNNTSSEETPAVSTPSKTVLVLKAMRIHQWAKNLLVVIPLLLGHQAGSLSLVLQVVVAFFSFNLVASSVYVLNDLSDLESDRAHHTKKNRPFASGQLPLSLGYILIPVLMFSGFLLALQVTERFISVLGAYYLLTLAYTFVLKHKPLLDVLVLALLYTIRIIAGAEAAMQNYSFWLLSFSLFFFFSLAFVKRYSELFNIQSLSDGRTSARGYEVSDLQMLGTLGATSGNIAVLVLALYINSPEVRYLYMHPGVLWGICPLMLFWIGRVWLLTGRGEMHEDPIVFALKDKVSYLLGVLALFVAVVASW